MKRTLTYLILISAAFIASAQDTVHYGDSVYMFTSPIPGACLGARVIFSDAQMNYAPRHVAQAYTSDTVTWIYGIAITEEVRSGITENDDQSYYDSIDSVRSGECFIATLLSYDSQLNTTGSSDIEPADEVAFSLSPKPAHGTVNVLTDCLPATLVLYDPQGRTVYTATLRARNTAIGIADLTRGVYHVSLTATDGTAIKRLVIE